MPTHTSSCTVQSLAIFDKVKLNKGDLLIDEVYFGSQNQIPVATACIIVPGPKVTTLAGVAGPGGRVFRDMTTFINVHRQVVTNTIEQDAGTEAHERLIVEQIAESVETLIHQDVTLGGIIIHGYVTLWDPMVTEFTTGSQFRTVQMTFVGRTKLNLSM